LKNFNDIPIFIAVVKEKSFSRAAGKLGLSVSAVSKRVSALERHLSVKLLNRTTRKLNLTEAGERYFEYAKQASSALEDAEIAATENDRGLSGTLRISSPVTFGNTILPNLLPIFLKKHPNIKIEIDLTDVFTKIKLEDFDLILTFAKFFNSSYKATNIHAAGGSVVVSPEFISLYGNPNIPEELANFNCLLPSIHEIPDEWIFIKENDEIKVKVSGNVQINNPLAIRDLTLKGLGISCLPNYIIYKDIKNGNLVTILNEFKIAPRIFQAIYPEKNYLPVKTRAFIDFLKYEADISRYFKKW